MIYTIEQLKKEYQLDSIKIFPGTNPNVTEEEVVTEIKNSIEQILNNETIEIN